jgi:5'-nucleotidase
MNVPDRAPEDIKGFVLARPGHRDYVDVVQVGHDPRGREYFWIGGERVDYDDEQPGTDTHALLKGYIPLTPVSYDLAGHHDLRILREWFAERAAR